MKALMACLLAALLVSPGYIATAHADESGASDGAQPANAAAEAVAAGQKNETVRISTDASGKVDSVKVEVNLTNPTSAQRLSDISDLSGISSDDYRFEQNGSSIVWQAQGDDVEYTGTSSAQVPLELSVTYYLNGSETRPDKMLGSEGHVKIRYEFANTLAQTRNVAGATRDMTTPLLVVTGILVDADNFRNLSVTNGRVINDGSQSIVIGYAVPGLQETIDVSRDDFDVPSYFEFEADVDNFEIGPALSLATPSVFEDIDADSLGSLADIGSMSELQDAMNKLVDGSKDLNEAVMTFADALGETAPGAKSLAEGALALDVGAEKLAEAIGKLGEAVEPIEEATSQLADGASSVAQGATIANAGAQQLAGGASELSSGLTTVLDGAEGKPGMRDAASGARELASAAQDLNDAIESLSIGLSQANQGAQALAAGLDPQALTALAALLQAADNEITAYNEKAATIAARADAVEAQAGSALASLDDAAAAINAISTEGVDEPAKSQIETQKQAALQAIETSRTDLLTVQSAAAELSSAASAASTDATSAAASAIDPNAFAQASATANAVASALGDMETALGSADVPGTILYGSSSIADGSAGLSDGLASAVEGLESAKSGSDAVSSGAAALASPTSGLPQVAAGASQVSDGISAFGQQASELANGIGALDEGAAELAKGASAVSDGLFALSTALDMVADGSAALEDGSKAYAEGVSMFNDEGIATLVNAFDGDIAKLQDTLDALGSMASSYDTFSGKADGTQGSVRFIFETAGVEKD